MNAETAEFIAYAQRLLGDAAKMFERRLRRPGDSSPNLRA
jgi:hypothetical protein